MMKKLGLCLVLSGALWGSLAWAADYSSATGGQNALLVNGETKTYSNITVEKSGSSSGETADFEGTNAAVLAKGGAKLTITGSSTTITTNGAYANGVFSYGGSSSGNGDGTTVTISDATITTSVRNSGGIMTTGGGVMNASNLTITTSGGSSAAIRSDRGGGTVTVSGGTYTTSGSGSPAIYSTADITVSNATLKSNVAQGVVVEGGNSVTLNDCTVSASNTTLNSDNDTTYQAVLIYQSMSGDASDGESSFSMTGGSLTNAKGDIFHVTNTTSTITLSGAAITNNDSSGAFLRATADSWGTSGSNGGHVTLNASGQTLKGDMVVDSISSLTLNLTNSSTFTGAITRSSTSSSSAALAASDSSVAVTVGSGSTWNMTGDSYVTSLTNNGTITANGHTLYVNGTAYDDVDSGQTDDDDSVDSGDSGTNEDSGNNGGQQDSGNSDSQSGGNDGQDSGSSSAPTSGGGSGGCDIGLTSLGLAAALGLLLGGRKR